MFVRPRCHTALSDCTLQKSQQLWRDIGGKAGGFVDWVGAPEMAGTRHHDRARKKAGLLERGQEFLRLGRRIDNVVLMAVHQQKPRGVSVHRGIAEGRGFEEYAATDRWGAAEEFLGSRVSRPGDQIMLPLRDHVVDAVNAYDRVYIGAYRSMGIVVIFAAKLRPHAG